MTRQMPLDFGHRAALGREDFLIAPSNQDAVAWLDLWPEWPARGLVIYGPPASGKTHLAEVWRATSGAGCREGAELAGRAAPEILAGRRALVVENADRGIDERALLHLYNYLAAEGGSLLLTAQRPPVQWQVALADLRSRLLALPSVAVGTPDDALIEAVIVKQFSDRQVRVAPDVIAYLVPRLERSLAAVRSLVQRLDAAALAAQRPITVPLAREILQGLGITTREE